MAAAPATSIKLDAEIKERMNQLAIARDRTLHWMLLEAVKQFVEREEKREAFRQDGIRAWNKYQMDGLHVTAKEANEWLAKLAAGRDVEPPECHL